MGEGEWVRDRSVRCVSLTCDKKTGDVPALPNEDHSAPDQSTLLLLALLSSRPTVAQLRWPN